MIVESKIDGGIRLQPAPDGQPPTILVRGRNEFSYADLMTGEQEFVDAMVSGGLATVVEPDAPANVVPIRPAVRAPVKAPIKKRRRG